VFHAFNAKTADELWRTIAGVFRAGEGVGSQASRAGSTRELLHVCVSIDEPQQRWILSREPPLNPAFAIAEVVWLVEGRQDAGFLNHWNPVLPRFAGTGPVYHGAYGYRLRENFGFDQLVRAFEVLRRNPDSRQVVLQTWDATKDFPRADGEPAAEDIPCNIASMLKVREGRLDWLQVLRSNDLYLGLPHNIVQFTSLQEILAGWLGVSIGQYQQVSDSLHVYERDWDVLTRIQPVRTPARNSDSLMFQKSEADQLWSELSRRMERLAYEKEMAARDWLRNACWLGAPEAFQNMLRVVAADDARRRGWDSEADSLGRECTNPSLVLALTRWVERCFQRRAGAGAVATEAIRAKVRP